MAKIIKIAQATLFVSGMLGAQYFCQNHFESMQIPGFFIAMAISWWLTPEIRNRALKLGLVDNPDEERRIHKVPIPRLGGVAIYMSIVLTLTLLIAIAGRFPHNARFGEGGMLGIAAGGTIIFILGLLDDLESIPAKLKLLVQILAGCAAYSLGVRIKSIPIPVHLNFDFGFLHIVGGVPIELGQFSMALSVLWLVGIANAVNLIDGMDGLAAGVSAISALTIWSVTLAPSLDRPYAALMSAILAGGLMGFLRWNFNPARIFMGDSGAYLTGFILAAVSITGVIKGAAAATVIVPTVLLVVLILFFPIVDTSFAILRRVAKGKSIFSPDSGHIHHRLLNTGLNQKSVAYLIYFVSSVFGLIACFCVGQQEYFLKLACGVLVIVFFFAEVLNRDHQRGGPEIDSEEK